MKLIVAFIMRTFRDILLKVADMALGGYNSDPSEKLMIVMVLTPLVFNTLQLWIIDNLIKRSERHVILLVSPEKLLAYILPLSPRTVYPSQHT